MAPRYVIGLTGNIASGKSVVARMLAALHADVIDADHVAHETLAPDTEQAAAVARRFGSDIIRSDGSVDRAALGRIVFADPVALADLEAIVHPVTRRRILDRLACSRADVAVIEAIKLLEGPLVNHVNAVWAVTAPRELRIERLVGERELSPDDAARRVDAQNPEDEKVARADVVIRNDGSIDDLRERVAKAWRGIRQDRG
ncbi:MAG: dephospho-CoA kinase [Chloroflexi bacterium]|nr:dephospho-CoA kinase [Chloroflexota bacterium]